VEASAALVDKSKALVSSSVLKATLLFNTGKVHLPWGIPRIEWIVSLRQQPTVITPEGY